MGWPHQWLPNSSTEFSRPKAGSGWFQSGGGGDGFELPAGIDAADDGWSSEFAEQVSGSLSTQQRQDNMYHALHIQRQQMLQVDAFE